MVLKARYWLVCAVLGCLLAPLARADQLAEIRQRGELLCRVLGTDEPLSFVDPATHTIIGYDVDLCGVVAAKIGVKPTVHQKSHRVALQTRQPLLRCAASVAFYGCLDWHCDEHRHWPLAAGAAAAADAACALCGEGARVSSPGA